jgi:hypothetical protein
MTETPNDGQDHARFYVIRFRTGLYEHMLISSSLYCMIPNSAFLEQLSTLL